MKIDFQPKQVEFIRHALLFERADDGVWRNRYSAIWYGGAIRGGKTFAMIGLFILLCKLFPGSRWAILRRTISLIKANTLPKIQELIPPTLLAKQPTAHGNPPWTAVINTGGKQSQIYFFGENWDRDKNQFDWSGREANGFGMEEGNELQEKTYQKAFERKGTWQMDQRYIVTKGLLDVLQFYWPDEHAEMKVGDEIYPAINLVTCNPSKNWAKRTVYDPWKRGQLDDRIKYIPAKATDNPKGVTKRWIEEKRLIMDEVSFERYVEGDWEISDNDKPFITTWEPRRHVYLGDMRDMFMQGPVYISCDQNVEPPAAQIWQYGKGWVHLLAESKLKSGDVYDIAEWVLQNFPNRDYFITGDPSGYNRSVVTRGGASFYKILAAELGVHESRVIAPKAHMMLIDSRAFCNSIFKAHPGLRVHHSCERTIADLETARVDKSGVLVKSRNRESEFLDYFDCTRYALETFFPEWIDAHQKYL